MRSTGPTAFRLMQDILPDHRSPLGEKVLNNMSGKTRPLQGFLDTRLPAVLMSLSPASHPHHQGLFQDIHPLNPPVRGKTTRSENTMWVCRREIFWGPLFLFWRWLAIISFTFLSDVICRNKYTVYLAWEQKHSVWLRSPSQQSKPKLDFNIDLWGSCSQPLSRAQMPHDFISPHTGWVALRYWYSICFTSSNIRGSFI